MRGRIRFLPLIDLFAENSRRFFWSLILFLTFFSGCAHLSPTSSSSYIWRSTKREPVWIRHDLPPRSGFVYLRSTATSRTSLAEARAQARENLADALVKRFVSEKFHFTKASREKLKKHILDDLQLTGPLVVVDSWETKTLPHSENPFLIQRSVWILVRAPSGYVPALRRELKEADRERFRRIRVRHQNIERALRQKDGTTILLLLAENRRGFRSIHAKSSLSADDQRRFARYLKAEDTLWSAFRGSSVLRSLQTAGHSVKIYLPLRRPTSFLLYAGFKISKKDYPLTGFLPQMSLSPVLPLLPFPPPPLYWRGSDVSASPYRVLSLYWSADLGWYDRYRDSDRLVYHCTRTSFSGMSRCQVDRWPLAGETSSLELRLDFPKNGPEGNLLQKAAEKVRGKIPVRFPGSRGSHPLFVRIRGGASEEIGPKSLVSGQREFGEPFKEDLVQKGFLVFPGSGRAGEKQSLFLKTHRPFTLDVRWKSSKRLSKTLGGTLFVLDRIDWAASVSGPPGAILWAGQGHVFGTGVGKGEATVEALKELRRSLVNTLSRLLWVRPAERPDDRFIVMRLSLLDGRAYCGEEESP